MKELSKLTETLGGSLSYSFKNGDHEYKVKFNSGSFIALSKNEQFAIDAVNMYLKSKFPTEYKYATKTNAPQE